MIKQTWFGKILCRLGVHLIVSTPANQSWNGSIVGGCIRCNKSFQWDF